MNYIKFIIISKILLNIGNKKVINESGYKTKDTNGTNNIFINILSKFME